MIFPSHRPNIFMPDYDNESDNYVPCTVCYAKLLPPYKFGANSQTPRLFSPSCFNYYGLHRAMTFVEEVVVGSLIGHAGGAWTRNDHI